jgi:hypothetical protein
MPSTATVTSKVGPAQTVTAQVITNVVRMEVLTAPKSVLSIQQADGKIQEFDLSATTTFTVTISAGNLTITISQ